MCKKIIVDGFRDGCRPQNACDVVVRIDLFSKNLQPILT